jgi:hypothetical protein
MTVCLQSIDVVVDTGSPGMGVPIAKPETWNKTRDFELLDYMQAGAVPVACNDTRCIGR